MPNEITPENPLPGDEDSPSVVRTGRCFRRRLLPLLLLLRGELSCERWLWRGDGESVVFTSAANICPTRFRQ
jgi:hypothetical protein